MYLVDKTGIFPAVIVIFVRIKDIEYRFSGIVFPGFKAVTQLKVKSLEQGADRRPYLPTGPDETT